MSTVCLCIGKCYNSIIFNICMIPLPACPSPIIHSAYCAYYQWYVIDIWFMLSIYDYCIETNNIIRHILLSYDIYFRMQIHVTSNTDQSCQSWYRWGTYSSCYCQPSLRLIIYHHVSTYAECDTWFRSMIMPCVIEGNIYEVCHVLSKTILISIYSLLLQIASVHLHHF